MNSFINYVSNLLQNTRFWQILAIIVLAAGILLRLVIWWQQRPIFLDEANLIRNYAERSYFGLFQNLDYEQYAPPFFSIMVKACINVFGNNELATRLFPLLCSIATLFLFYRLCRRFLNLPATVAALAFLAFGKIFTDYATECKQYATDGLIALLLLELSFRINVPKGFNRSTLIWSFIGIVAVWFSMPSVFILAGIGFYWLFQSLKMQSKQIFWGSVFAGVCWLLSFGAYFFLLLQHNAESDYLQNFHHEYFLAFPPTNLEELELLGTQLGRIFSKAIGKTAIAKILAGIALIFAIIEIIKHRKENQYQPFFWLILMPVVFCFAASALRYYSLLTRLSLFFMPLLILLVFRGLQRLGKHSFGAGIAIVLVLVVLSNQQYLTEMHQPFHSDYAEAREALKFAAKEQQPNEPVIASDDVLPVMHYYTQLHQKPLPLQNLDLKKIGYENSVEVKLDSLRNLGYRKVWFVASTHDKNFSALVAQPEKILKRKDDYFSYAVLYKLQ